MAFYDLSKRERMQVVEKINLHLLSEVKSGQNKHTLACF